MPCPCPHAGDTFSRRCRDRSCRLRLHARNCRGRHHHQGRNCHRPHRRARSCRGHRPRHHRVTPTARHHHRRQATRPGTHRRPERRPGTHRRRGRGRGRIVVGERGRGFSRRRILVGVLGGRGWLRTVQRTARSLEGGGRRRDRGRRRRRVIRSVATRRQGDAGKDQEAAHGEDETSDGGMQVHV